MSASRAIKLAWRRLRRFPVATFNVGHKGVTVLVPSVLRWFINVSESWLSFFPFLISLWLSSIYRSIISGWKVSGMDTQEKQDTLRAMLGRSDD